jgi:hypothetical protein
VSDNLLVGRSTDSRAGDTIPYNDSLEVFRQICECARATFGDTVSGGTVSSFQENHPDIPSDRRGDFDA